ASLPELLSARQPVEVQLATLQALGGLDDPRVGPAIVDRWKALSPSVRREAAEVLFARSDRVASLLDAIEARTILAGELDSARAAQLLSHRDVPIRERAARLVGNASRVDRGRAVDAMRPSLTKAGDRTRGRAIFEKTCASCHMAE